MATKFIFTPESATPPSTNFATLTKISQDRMVLAFDASVAESTYWTAVAPTTLSGALVADVHYCMASATTGDLYFKGSIEAITPGDAVDLDATSSFDITTSGTGTVPGTAGYEQKISITMTSIDSIQPGDYFRFKLERDIADTASGDAYVLVVEFKDAT